MEESAWGLGAAVAIACEAWDRVERWEQSRCGRGMALSQVRLWDQQIDKGL